MRYGSHTACAGLLVATLALAACGGGGGGGNADVSPAAPTPAAPPEGPNLFLVFPNPQVQPDGSFQTLAIAYAQAYYDAVDPTNQRDTLDKWRAVNGFGSGTGTEVTVVFGDVRDLGYGRRMTARQNINGTLAIMVENYAVPVGAAYTYSTVNLDAAVVRDRRWHIATNAIEFSPGPNGGVSFPKFFTFDPNGVRKLTANMDGLGEKAMPGPCLTCHGGRGDPLTPPDATGRPRFALVQNTASMARGDAQAHLQPLEADTFDYSSASGFSRAAQEAAIKTINRMVLCSYPIPAPTGLPEDACRRPAIVNEWQGTAAAIIKNGYGGPGLPNPTFADTYLPNSWLVAGQSTLYLNSVVPACRACHILRGTGNQSDIDFDTFEKFQGYADRIKALVFDRGNMPLAKLVFDRFHTTNQVSLMAAFLDATSFPARDSTGAVVRPGRPVADPGPDRTVRQGATTLSAANSQFSSAYQWSIVSGPNGAVPPTGAALTNPGSVQPVFNAAANGTYVLQLATSRGSAQSAAVPLTIVVNDLLAPAPAAIRFPQVKAVLQAPLGGCNTCHFVGGTAPVVFTDIDRNGDGIVGDATDDLWFYTEVRGLINFTDIAASPLLRKPSGRHHNGGLRPGFDTSAAPGQGVRSDYDLILNWILNNAPQ